MDHLPSLPGVTIHRNGSHSYTCSNGIVEVELTEEDGAWTASSLTSISDTINEWIWSQEVVSAESLLQYASQKLSSLMSQSGSMDTGDDWGDDEPASEIDWSERDDVDNDAEFDRWYQIKKRFTKKDEELRLELKSSSLFALSVKSKRIFEPKEVSTMLIRSVLEIMRTGPAHGIFLSPKRDNPFELSLRLTSKAFSSQSQISRDLVRLGQQYQSMIRNEGSCFTPLTDHPESDKFDSVDFQLSLAMDTYPYYPPALGLVRPRLSLAALFSVSLLPQLNPLTWSSITSLSDVIQWVILELEEHGSVDFSQFGLLSLDSVLI